MGQFGTPSGIDVYGDKKVPYEVTNDTFGVWRTYVHPNGSKFTEYSSHRHEFGMPLFQSVSGISPETGKAACAKGVIAVGQWATGYLAIGQFASGWFSVGQFCTARVAGVGQFVLAPLAIGQMSIAVATICQLGIAGWGTMQSGAVIFGGLGQKLLQLF